MAALAFALIVAATTQASSGILGYFQLEGSSSCELGSCIASAPREFAHATASTMNANGTGGASPGDVYVMDEGSGSRGRIQQISTSDQFIRLWGAGVVKSGPGNADEAQALRVDATAGAFKLGFGADTTADIPATATASQVEAALNGLGSIGAGGVSVSGGPGNAGGTTPYLVTFDGGSLADKDQPLLKATNGSAPLNGGGGKVSAYTTRIGGTGFEICRPADGDECAASTASFENVLAGHLISPRDITVDQTTGDLYVSNRERIEAYSASGQFLRAWGQDVVASGPDDSSAPDERKRVAVKATGGTFTLGLGFPPETTTPIPFDADAATVEAALNNLGEIGGNYSSVSVTGGPGDLEGLHPYEITFHGLLGGDDLGPILTSSANGLTVESGTKSAAVTNVAAGGGYEVCEIDDACKAGVRGEAAGAFNGDPPSVAVAPDGAPNAGNVLAVDLGNNRVQEFTAEGAFVRAFGWDVDATEVSTGFEVCTAESGHICKAGTDGSGAGQFAAVSAVAEDTGGTIYTVESKQSDPLNRRVQKFTPAGPGLTPSPFGTDEVQALRVNAGSGQFRLTFGAEHEGVQGTGLLTKGSPVITNVNAIKGAFAVGQPIRANGSLNDYIVAVGANTITVSQPAANSSCCGLETFFSGRPYTTPDLPYDASASEVESALNAIPLLNANGSSVSVTEGPGNVGGTSPYLISFDGGPLARTDPTQIVASNGSTPLSGGSGAGANTASVVTTTPGGPNGSEPLSSSFALSAPSDIAIGPGDHVLVAKRYPFTYTSCANSAPSLDQTRILELDSSGLVLDTSDPCMDDYGYVSDGGDHQPDITVNSATGHPYLLPDYGAGFLGPRVDIFGPPGPPPGLALEPVSKITATGGTITGTINPNGPGTAYPGTTGTPGIPRTTYRVEYREASEATWAKYTPDVPVGNGTSPVPLNVGVAGLAPSTEYELKVVVVKPFTARIEETKSFTTLPAPPEIEAFSSSDVTVNSAELHALINPQGTATSYHFEYGTTPAYGQSTPETNIGESHQGQAAAVQIKGLQDTVYHFRVLATNASGTTASADQTFTFHPPVCPNQTVRQQTGAAYLPDCRAYELVSPEDAGGTTLFSGGPQSPYASNPPRVAFVGQLATIPDSGRKPIDTSGDLYVATRGASGWRSRYIGPSAEEAGCVGGRPIVNGAGPPSKIQNDVMADPGLNRIIDWNLGNPLKCATHWFGNLKFSDFNTAALASNAPYVWSAHGDFLDRWPTSVADTPGAEENFACPRGEGISSVVLACTTYVDASKDLSHFVFSTQSGLFGEGGLPAAPGSAYDNDTAHNTLTLISKLAGGGPIPQEPGAKAGAEELIQFPAVSADGSHILMGTAAKPACKQRDYPLPVGDGEHEQNPICPIITQPTHLYMRVNDAVTYDVSSGKAVKYIGSTPDGTKVYFTSDEQLTGDDTDQSTDLYGWSENGVAPQLTKISAGDPAPAGDTNGCASTWTTDCDVKTYDDSKISSALGNQGGAGSWAPSNPNPGYTDNAIAAKSGDIYFYSPEQLVASKGAPGKENLYVYRNGALEFIAALEDDRYCIFNSVLSTSCSNGALGRLQVTPDGRYAAFITTSRITAYDNQGHAEMYRYDADAEKVECVSCRPDGSAPVGQVFGSQGGRFITDLGRVFFNTTEALDPRDTNAKIGATEQIEGADVYEFVDGRAQLITSGTGTGGGAGGFLGDSLAGFYGVSADGVDVYFSTYETLVGQDRNGAQLKFYDARTNGGFSFVPLPAPCAAADECHGPSSLPPSPIASGTGVALGSGGNARSTHKSRHKKKQHKRKKHHLRRAVNHRPGGAR